MAEGCGERHARSNRPVPWAIVIDLPRSSSRTSAKFSVARCARSVVSAQTSASTSCAASNSPTMLREARSHNSNMYPDCLVCSITTVYGRTQTETTTVAQFNKAPGSAPTVWSPGAPSR